jgi:hypothetical protein
MKTNHYPKRVLKSTAFLIAIFLVWIAPHAMSVAATVPAGTTVVVTMVDPLSSHESRGRTFKTKLATDLKPGGKTVVPAGTIIYGVVETSRNPMVKTTTNPLTVNLKSIAINGQRIPIKTTGAGSPETVSAFTAQQKRRGVSVGKGIAERGTRLEFRLAEPLNL